MNFFCMYKGLCIDEIYISTILKNLLHLFVKGDLMKELHKD